MNLKFPILTLLSYVAKINLEAKVASFKIPGVERVSEVQLGAMKTIGMHNYHNAAAAALSVIGLDTAIDAEAISSTIGKLEVPPHRMQIGELKLDKDRCHLGHAIEFTIMTCSFGKEFLSVSPGLFLYLYWPLFYISQTKGLIK